MLVREANIADIPALVALRMRLFCEVGELDTPGGDPALWQATRDYFTRAMGEGSTRSWVVETEGALVACGTLALFVRPPYPGTLSGREGYVLNIVTLPAWRRRGMAGALLDAMLVYAREQQLGKLWLHTSDEGRALYERRGFVANTAYLEWCPAL
ncbi:GNAT family N-acetyltransferase [Aeromonas aquatica]|uniref:GNAT family N-acetyltransferase n=1 Tax=Aeromonas aquatica TaxID=558964 RepID=UPI00286F8AFB|nr:GNAT family N-acetyltransferase [Aeromonas aquatica]